MRRTRRAAPPCCWSRSTSRRRARRYEQSPRSPACASPRRRNFEDAGKGEKRRCYFEAALYASREEADAPAPARPPHSASLSRQRGGEEAIERTFFEVGDRRQAASSTRGWAKPAVKGGRSSSFTELLLDGAADARVAAVARAIGAGGEIQSGTFVSAMMTKATIATIHRTVLPISALLCPIVDM